LSFNGLTAVSRWRACEKGNQVGAIKIGLRASLHRLQDLNAGKNRAYQLRLAGARSQSKADTITTTDRHRELKSPGLPVQKQEASADQFRSTLAFILNTLLELSTSR
jgi:hypothetical protein